MRFVIWLVVVGGCFSGATAATPNAGLAHSKQAMIGETVLISANWRSLCSDTSFDKRRGIIRESGPCRDKPFTVDVRCSRPCEVVHDAKWPAYVECTSPCVDLDHSVWPNAIRPLVPGPLEVTMVLHRTDTGESQAFVDKLDVVLPDRVGLLCKSKPGPYPEGSSCGPEGVSATTPFISPVVYVGTGSVTTAALHVNGRPLPANATTLSLVDLYPAAAQGQGIVPGTYNVTLDIAGITSTWQVVAR